MNVWMPVAVLVASYLVGSLSFAVIVSRLMGLNDPRSYGSKNPGATNVLRSGSKKAAISMRQMSPVALCRDFMPCSF